MWRDISKILLTCCIILWASSSYGEERCTKPEDKTRYECRRNIGLRYDKNGIVDPTPDVVSLGSLPKDKYGFIDWSKAIRDRNIAPRDYADKKDGEEQTVEFSGNVLIKAKMDFMPDVIFPHSAHNMWLECEPCHTKIFAMKAGETPISMKAIWQGEYCGRCHDKVAFPLRNCFRCHSAPRRK